MRNFGSKQNRFSADSESGRIPKAQAASADQIAIVWNGTNEIIAVSPMLNESTGSYEIDFAKVPLGSSLKTTLDMRRKSQPNMPPVSERTHFLTVVPDYSERTRILALNGNILSLRDGELNDWLVNAEREMYLGTDNHPVFETALDDTSCCISRLPNGQVSMTEIPRQNVENVQDRIQALVGRAANNLVIETPLRCVTRYFLTSQPDGEEILRPEKEKEATAILLVSGDGFCYGLWSPACGLFSEYAFAAPPEIKALLARKRLNQNPKLPSADEQQERHLLELYIRQAFDQLFLQLSPEKLEQMELSNYAQAVWAAEPDLAELVDRVATDYSSKTGLEFFSVQAPLGEAVAGGLLLGSFGFGDDRAVGAEIVTPVNMARDLLFMADKEEVKRQQQQEISIQQQRTRAALALWAAPVLMAAVLIGLALNMFRSQVMLGIREVRADVRAQELKPAVDRRKSYEANLKWYQEFIKQVSALRKQQPVGTNLLYELNSNYPLTIDDSFYISDMKLAVTGGVEIKGLARNKDAITSFLRALEFAGGSESGKKLFSNLTYEVREGVDLTNTTGGQVQLPTMAGSTLQGTNPAPGVIAWNIRGNYLPAVEFAPPDPTKKPAPNKPPANANTNAGQPGNANTAPAANTNTAQ